MKSSERFAILMQPGDLLQFEDFEIDPSSRCLRRNGERIPLPRRSFDVLLYLARRAGDVVTREELMKGVWPDAFVDENSLSQSISALRRALEDRPGDARFVATLPGRGYQFLTAVRSVPSPNGKPERSAGLLLEERTLRTQVVTQVEDRVVASHTRWRLLPGLSTTARRGVLIGGLVVLLAVAGVVGWQAFKAPGPEHVDTVIADLENDTGDSDFDHTLNKVLQIDLQQSPFFTVTSEGRVRKALLLMHRPPGEAITATLAREACQRLNEKVYLAPGIARLGQDYVVTLVAGDCADGHTLGARRKEVVSKEEVLSAFSAITMQVRRDVGESRESLRHFDKPLYEEPTSSLEALKAYSEATRLGDSGKFAESIALYHHAIDLDPKFAVAYADMSSMYYNIDDKVHDAEAITKAYQLRDTVNTREGFYIVLRYHQSVTGDLHALLDTLHDWAAMYPEDNLPLSDLVNFETWTGQYDQAAMHADMEHAMEERRNIHNGIAYEIAARAYHHANMPDKVRATYAEAMQWKVDTQGLHSVMLEFAADNGDTAGVEQQIAWSRNTPAESHILQEAASVALAAGQDHRAEALFREARAAAERDKVVDALVDLDEYHVRMLVDMGLTADAKALLKTMPATDPSMDKSFTEAEVGSEELALSEAKAQLAGSPTDTLMTAEYVPSVRAAVALREGRPQEAVELLRGAAPYEMRDPTVPYLRGQAFLAAHQGAEAEAEFRKLAGQPWLADPAAPLIELSQLGLARALALRGETGDAVAAYQRFLADWSKADADLPALAQAKCELHHQEALSSNPGMASGAAPPAACAHGL